jgi:hypothetical protein
MDRVRLVSDVMPVGLTFHVLKRRRGWGGGGDEGGGEGDERDVERERWRCRRRDTKRIEPVTKK